MRPALPQSWLSRAGAALLLALLASGCSTTGDFLSQPVGDQDALLRADRLLGYCEKLNNSGSAALAVGMCARAHELAPRDPAPLQGLGVAFANAGQPARAAEVFQEVLSLAPDDAEAQYQLGKAQLVLGDLEAAEAAFMALAAARPEDARAYNALGVISDQLGQHAKAQELYRTALGLAPGNIPIRNNLGLSLALAGQGSEAVQLLEELAQREETGALGPLHLAYAQAIRKNEAVLVTPAPSTANAAPR